jgi:rubrerythrin
MKGRSMDSEEYRRLYAAFAALAQQSNVPDVRARWIALARASSDLAKDPLKLPVWSGEDEENAHAASALKLLARLQNC